MFTNIERSRAIIIIEKLVFCALGIKIIKFIYNYYSKYSNKNKIRKICV